MINSISTIPQLYHFTDTRNLAAIRAHGGLLPRSMLDTQGIAIAAPGGNEHSVTADGFKGMENYVHLCLRPKHPMEYRARQDRRIEQSLFLNIDPSVLTWPGVMFTSDVSNKSGVEAIPISQAESLIDFEILYANLQWKGNPERLGRINAAEKCEILVPAHIPLKFIRNMPSG